MMKKKVVLAVSTCKPVQGRPYHCTAIVKNGRFDYECREVSTSSVVFFFKVSEDVCLIETRNTMYLVKKPDSQSTKFAGMYETPVIGDTFSCFSLADRRKVYRTSTVKSIEFISKEVCEVKTKNSVYYCYF